MMRMKFRKAGKAGKRSPISLKIVQKGWKRITNSPYFWLDFCSDSSGNPEEHFRKFSDKMDKPVLEISSSQSRKIWKYRNRLLKYKLLKIV